MIRMIAFAIALAAPCQTFAQVPAKQIEAEAKAAFARLAPIGMAVAVVQPEMPVWLRGYGTTQSDGGTPIDGDTAFPIHSMTKSFTVAAIGLLADEGRLSWDDPVRKHIPEFAMSDPYVSEHITIRDLLVHNSGLALGAGDLLRWPDQTATVEEIIAGLRHLPLDRGFREGFAYDNILYFVAGEVVARASGVTWSEFVEQRLFLPLDMTSCTTSSDRKRDVVTATQHSRPPGGAPVPRNDIILYEDPAGSISCSIRDMAKWTQFQLGDGSLPDGSRLLAADTMQVMHKPLVALTPPRSIRQLAGSHFNDVAPGWFVSDFAGTLAVEHGGVGPGGMTNMILLPEHRAAVVVLVNDLVPAMMLANRIADVMVRGDEASDWIGWVEDREARRAASAAAQMAKAFSPPVDAKAPQLPISAYAGTYRDPWYGDITVRSTGDGLTLHFTRSKLLEGPLLPWNGETFLARWPDRSLDADALVTFIPNANGNIGSMQIRPLSRHTDFSYDYEHLTPQKIGD